MGNEINLKNLQENGYTNVLKYRGENKASGISYDYMDKLQGFVDNGIFVDAQKDGFTNAEKQSLEKELMSIHKEHGYGTDFENMLPGTKTEYSYNDFIRLAQAAGYVLKEQPVVEKTPTNVSKENSEVKLSKVSEMVLEHMDSLSLNLDANNSVEKVTNPAVDTNLPKESGVAEERLIAAIESEPLLVGKTPKERVKILAKQKSDLMSRKYGLESKTETYQTRNFLGVKKYKTREYTQEELQERKSELAKVEQELDRVAKYQVYVERVQANDYWVDKYSSQSLEDEKGNVLAEYPTYYEDVVLVNGKEQKVARVDDYDVKTLKTNSKYYSVDVQKVGSPKYLGGTYYSVVPDINNELKNVQTIDD